MKKKILAGTSIVIFFIIGFIFMKLNFNTKKVSKQHERDFIVFKSSGEQMYPFRDTFAKGIKIKDAVAEMQTIYRVPDKYLIKEKRSWKEISGEAKLFKDAEVKCEFN